jgi:hypothetical protein
MSKEIDELLLALKNVDNARATSWHSRKRIAQRLADELTDKIRLAIKADIEENERWHRDHPDAEGPDWDVGDSIFKGMVAAFMAAAGTFEDIPFKWREGELKAALRFVTELVAALPTQAIDPKIEKGWQSLISGRA